MTRLATLFAAACLLLSQACAFKECLGPDPHPECPDYGVQRDTGYGYAYDTDGAPGVEPIVGLWVLKGASFTDGGRLDGFMVYDQANDTVLDFALCAGATPEGGWVPPGGAPWTALEYTPSSASVAHKPSSNGLRFTSHALFGPYANSFRSLRLGEAPRRASASDTSASRKVEDGSLECVNCAPTRYVVDGRWVFEEGVDEVDLEPCA